MGLLRNYSDTFWTFTSLNMEFFSLDFTTLEIFMRTMSNINFNAGNYPLFCIFFFFGGKFPFTGNCDRPLKNCL